MDGRWHPQTQSRSASPARIRESAPRFSSGSPLRVTSRCRCSVIDTVGRELSTSQPIEALIADVSLVSKAELPRLVRTLGPNRPLILVGDPEDAIEEVPRDAAWMDRPVTRDAFLLSVALGLAEGRPSRRSPRKLVPRLLSSIDGISAKVMDVSTRRRAPGGHGHLAGVAAAVLHVEGAGLRRRRQSEAGLGRDAGSGLGVVRRSPRAAQRAGQRGRGTTSSRMRRTAARRLSIRECSAARRPFSLPP